MHVLEYLTEIAHVDGCSADRAIAEMIGLDFNDTIRIDAGLCHLSFSGPAMRKCPIVVR